MNPDWSMREHFTAEESCPQGSAARMGRHSELVGAAGSCGQLSGLGVDDGAALGWIARPQAQRLPAMSVEHLFTQALGLGSPWKVVSCDFDPLAKSLELDIYFERGARIADPETGEICPVHDTVQRSWEHLKFFEHRTTIHARVPRIKTLSGGVTTVEVPWAKPHGG